MTAYLRDVRALLHKDLLLELRSRETVPAMLLFILATLVVFHFAVPGGLEPAVERKLTYGLLWIAVMFTAILGLTRAFAAEREQRLLDGLVLAPCDRSAIWLAKSLAVLVFLLLAEAIALPAFALFFSTPSASAVAALLLADIGIVAVGTILSAAAAASRTRELILPVLLLPLLIPVVIGGVGASIADEPLRFLGFLALYDAIFASISFATFEYVVSE